MSNHKSLVFFNKEGDYLNFQYNELVDRFEGDILFHENSTDTFKTYAIYMLEDVPSFEFESPGELTTNKFQLFNEYGFHFYGAKFYNQKVNKIEPVNNSPEFYTKWIYGQGFDAKFPIGTIIQFDTIGLEFTDLTQTYVVVGSKQGAIMILTQMDNSTFESTYFTTYIEPEIYQNFTISGINAFGVYDYVDANYNDRLSKWNEPDFYSKYYLRKKLNVIGSKKNDGIYTVKDINLADTVHYEYSVSKNSLPQNTDLIIEVITRTDVPLVYTGEINFSSDNKMTIIEDYPQILKPGVEFKIIGSTIHTNFFTIEEMPQFSDIKTTYYFATASQVLYNNRVYQCTQAYTIRFDSIGDSTGVSTITPENPGYWTSNPTYIKVKEATSNEVLNNGQIYLTTDKYYYTFGWTSSGEATLASVAEKFSPDLKLFNIDLFYLDNRLRADLIYPSNYAKVNFYHTQLGPTYSIGNVKQARERLVEVVEPFKYELNYNYSVNKKYNIVFTDIDEQGIQLSINKMVYDEAVAFLYSGGLIDMERTIDRTVRNWLKRWYMRLFQLGITAELKYTGTFNSVFYNTIVLKSTYPNVPMNLEYVKVGITADYYIEHTKIQFTDLGPYLNIKINGKDYGQQTIFSGTTPNISATLDAWQEAHQDFLIEFGIVARAYNTILKLNIKSLIRLDVSITTGKLNKPGVFDYKITKYMIGNPGVLVASNEVKLPSSSDFNFEQTGFSTGMAFSINNTQYPWVNQDYTIQFLDPQVLNLSYQGPFWGLTQNPCDASGFMTLAFDAGFGQTDCTIPVSPTAATGASGPGGPFDPQMFDPTMFTVIFNPNGYTLNTYDLSFYPGTTNLVDIEYIQLTNAVYGFGDHLVVIDALYGYYITTIDLIGNTQSIEMEFNPLNSYLYCLSKEYLWVIDPTSNILVTSVTFSGGALAYDMEINPFNGDVYITYENKTYIHIWDVDNISQTPTTSISTVAYGYPGAMVFNDFEGDMYVTCGSSSVLRISGGEPGDDFTGAFAFPGNPNRVLQTSYGIPSVVKDYIFYEPVNEAIYVYGSSSLWKIDNGVAQSSSLTYSGGFSDIIFNNITNEMNISDASLLFTRLNLSQDSGTQLAIANYGYLTVNQYDGDIYLSSQSMNNIVVLQGSTGLIIHTEPLNAPTGRIIFNPERNSAWAIQPSTQQIVEIQVDLNLSILQAAPTFSEVGENNYGTLAPTYQPKESIWLKTRQYFRRPRENFEGDVPVKYYWRWMTDQVKDFFLYDFSGEQLSNNGPFAYTGPKPLTDIVLNYKPNKDLSKTNIPGYQQTVFDQIEYTLSYIDDEDDVSVETESMELFIGYKSEKEGAIRNVLQLYKKEEIDFEIMSDSINYITLKTVTTNGDKRGIISLSDTSTEIFTGRGLKPGHQIVIYISDTTNLKKQYISNNNAIVVKIRDVFTRYLVVDFFNVDYDFLEDETTVVSNYPTIGKTTYLKFRVKVKDREIGRFITYGETTEEDIRFKIELGNIGKLIAPEEVFIFKEYDINEGGIDWKILNRKRKEMLMNRNLIYPYIGSYKSLVNAINYFGYNDLQLNEYYREVIKKPDGSSNLNKLFKVEIPDIFDNTIKGWNEKDFLQKYLPSDNYEETNMFNLTYFITDKEGNYILEYSLDEIIIKLQGLKYWLKRNIIPLTHKIMDITGVSYFTHGNYIDHVVYDIRNIKIKEDMTPITFKLNEVYLYPINSGSTVYNCVLDFYTIIEGFGEKPEAVNINRVNGVTYQGRPDGSIKPYNELKDTMKLPDVFDIKIRTYKIYKEWAPYTIYSKGDKIFYYDKLYISTKDNNKLNNPKKYENVEEWIPLEVGSPLDLPNNDGVVYDNTPKYQVGTIVKYKGEVYNFSGLGATGSTVSPEFDPDNWLNITDWKEIPNEPVQYITEFRRGDDLNPFNFTIDSNIDPFLVIEVVSHSGYGQVYKDHKNYQIKGIKDLTEPYSYLDPIGPFIPIKPIEEQIIAGGGGI